MFMGPFDQQIAWSTSSMVGSRRFIERVWKLRERVGSEDGSSLSRILHKTIKKVTEDIDNLRFNTAVSTLMIAVNDMEKSAVLSRENFEVVIRLLAPFAPHVADELWESLGNKGSVHISAWPTYDPMLIKESMSTIMVQVSGKVRGSFVAAVGTAKVELETMAKALPEAAKWLNGKVIKKIIVVPERLVNIVINDPGGEIGT